MRLTISIVAAAGALALTACPPPSPDQGQAVQQANPPVAGAPGAAAPAPGAPAAGAAGPGAAGPGAPAPDGAGIPEAPPAVGDNTLTSADPPPEAPGAQPGAPVIDGDGLLPQLAASGPTVEVSGVVGYNGSQSGNIRVDFVQRDAGSGRNRVVHALHLDELGAWSVQLPVNSGEFKLVGFIDVDGNGPGPGEPAIQIEGFTVGTEALAGLSLQLVDGGLKAPPAGDE